MPRWLAGQVVIWGVGFALLRVFVVPAERCPSVDAGAVRAAVANASAWLVRNEQPDGSFLYGYHRGARRVSHEYSDARHGGVLFALYRVGETAAADKGLGWVQRRLIVHDDWSAFAGDVAEPEVGANALVVAGLMYRRRVTGDDRYDALAKRMGRFLVSQTRPDGSVLEFWSPSTRRPVPGVFGKFATGEAFYALTLLNNEFPGEGWDAPAHRVADYLANRRDEAEGSLTRQPDHWASYGLSELAETGLNETEVAFARRLAGYFGYEIRFIAQHTGRPLNMFTESGADFGVVGEASTALWKASALDPRLADLHDQLASRVTCLAGITVGRQTPASDPDPRAAGAWFYHGYTQMDDQQHSIGALLGAEKVLNSSESNRAP